MKRKMKTRNGEADHKTEQAGTDFLYLFSYSSHDTVPENEFYVMSRFFLKKAIFQQ